MKENSSTLNATREEAPEAEVDYAEAVEEFPAIEIVEEVEDNYIYNIANVKRMPEFPGGESKMYKWISEQIRYPVHAAESNIQGRVVVEFTINKSGYTENIRLLRSKGYDLDAEAIRVVATMPRWKPGYMNGNPVNVRYTLPINFKLQH